MTELIKPHGGVLVNREAQASELEFLQEKIKKTAQKVVLNKRELSDLEMISIGAFSPLEGFMGKDDYESVVQGMHLNNGLAFSIPITLAVTKEEANGLKEGEDVALFDNNNKAIGLLNLEEKYSFDKQKEAELVYLTNDLNHPGVCYLNSIGDVLLGGKVTLIEKPNTAERFADYSLEPKDTRAVFKKRGWKRVVGFQTRNPVHRAHEYIQKCALETVDGLLLHPLVGETKKDDIPADIRMACYEVLLDKYYPKERTVLSVLPAAMRYAGPREAIFHALVRKNYGCTHFIVGRDHAGVGNYYGSFDAHYIFDEFGEGELGITPMFFDYTFYCRDCDGMASHKTCPHESDSHISLSGTKVREMLQSGEWPPVEFTRPEVAKVLIAWAKSEGTK